MKRYLVFGYDGYYPAGAKQDIAGEADTIEEVRAISIGRDGMPSRRYDRYDVLDMQERRWLDESEWAAAK